jgi:hypothetical protein
MCSDVARKYPRFLLSHQNWACPQGAESTTCLSNWFRVFVSQFQGIFLSDTAESCQLNHSFEQWLMDVCSNRGYTEEKRTQMLVEWSKAQGQDIAILGKSIFCHCMSVMG